MSGHEFRIQTEAFEGPLDLLLHFIEKRKLLINDISLATVTDEFITHVKQQAAFPMSQTAHFIYIATTLLLIKSKSLLPTLSLSDEETENIEDLERRLKIFKFFKLKSILLSKRFGSEFLFFRQPTKNIVPTFAPPAILSENVLHEAVQRVVTGLPKPKVVQKATVKNVVSLEVMIDRLRERVQQSLRMSFKDFSGAGKAEKVDVIVSFLAVLELVKQEIITVRQESHFDDIHLENQSINTPKYGS